jgi:hypothetical protein
VVNMTPIGGNEAYLIPNGNRAYEYSMSYKSYSPPSKCIYRALGSLLKCPSSFSILVDISHDYHMTYLLNPVYTRYKRKSI